MAQVRALIAHVRSKPSGVCLMMHGAGKEYGES